jgi:hypothetical protein
VEKEMNMATPQEITVFIDEWLVANRDWIGDFSVDFALDVRNMVEQLAQLEVVPEPLGV